MYYVLYIIIEKILYIIYYIILKMEEESVDDTIKLIEDNYNDEFINRSIKDVYINYIKEFDSKMDNMVSYVHIIKYAGEPKNSQIIEISIEFDSDELREGNVYDEEIYEVKYDGAFGTMVLLYPKNYIVGRIGKKDNIKKNEIKVYRLEYKSKKKLDPKYRSGPIDPIKDPIDPISRTSSSKSDNLLTYALLILVITIIIILSIILVIFGIGYMIFMIYITGLIIVLISRRFRYNDITWKDSVNYSLFSWLYFVM